jgi:hypothetical protein
MTLVKSQLPSLTVGDETLENIPVSVTDLSFLGRALGEQVDGVLGHSFLRHFAMTLDYATNALTLKRPAGSPRSHWTIANLLSAGQMRRTDSSCRSS